MGDSAQGGQQRGAPGRVLDHRCEEVGVGGGGGVGAEGVLVNRKD